MTRAALLRQVNPPLSIEEIDVDEPRAGEVQIRLSAAGLCHSDDAFIRGMFKLPLPAVPGHEGSGIVTAVGPGVTRVAPGDRVILSAIPQCGKCYWCAKGQATNCEVRMQVPAMGGQLDGTTRLHRGTANIQVGDTVVIVGCGGVGLNVVQGARLAGAERIIAIDVVPLKLELATRFGATDVIDARLNDPVEQVGLLTGSRGADVAFEVTGLAKSATQVFDMTRRGGEMIFIGVATPDSILPVRPLQTTGKVAKGCLYGQGVAEEEFPRLLREYEQGLLEIDLLVSSEIALEEVNAGFDAMHGGEVARSVIVYH
jgi:S-(hydroxymethyl)glutathione dehydrogenase/alcohol dehydrogenase